MDYLLTQIVSIFCMSSYNKWKFGDSNEACQTVENPTHFISLEIETERRYDIEVSIEIRNDSAFHFHLFTSLEFFHYTYL